MDIRLATINDKDAIRRVNLSAFPEEENEQVAKLAVDLLIEKANPDVISVVAEIGGTIVGHVCFSPVQAEKHEGFLGYILAPLSVLPEYQKQKIGTKLVEYGMQKLSAMKVHTILVYGDPEYYGKFNFNKEAAQNYTPPYKLEYPFGWQALRLNDFNVEKPLQIRCVSQLDDPDLW